MMLAYPSPHTVRRNFALHPFQVPDEPLYTNPDMQANSSFSASAIQAILGTSAGDYNCFQMGVETFEVGAWI
jgi:tyrosinase